MPEVEGAWRNRIIWHYIEEARKKPPPTITLGPTVAATNGVFVIDSIGASNFQLAYPKFYGGTLDPETGRLYDARRPSGERAVQPEALRKRREKAKAARRARKKSRRLIAGGLKCRSPMESNGLCKGPFKLFERPQVHAFELLAEAAQEAEFIHAETGSPVRVQDVDGNFVYTSKGAPE